MDRRNGRVEGGTLVLVAKRHDAQKSHKLGTSNVHSLEIDISTGGPRILFAGMYRSPGLTPGDVLESFHFLSVVVVSVDKLLILGDFDAPKMNWVHEKASEDTFGYDLLKFVDADGMIQHVT